MEPLTASQWHHRDLTREEAAEMWEGMNAKWGEEPQHPDKPPVYVSFETDLDEDGGMVITGGRISEFRQAVE